MLETSHYVIMRRFLGWNLDRLKNIFNYKLNFRRAEIATIS